jgi:hypothetical protein
VGGWGESQFRRGAYTVVLFICTYFVAVSNKLTDDGRRGGGGECVGVTLYL